MDSPHGCTSLTRKKVPRLLSRVVGHSFCPHWLDANLSSGDRTQHGAGHSGQSPALGRYPSECPSGPPSSELGGWLLKIQSPGFRPDPVRIFGDDPHACQVPCLLDEPTGFEQRFLHSVAGRRGHTLERGTEPQRAGARRRARHPPIARRPALALHTRSA